jgi:hypothetical protein
VQALHRHGRSTASGQALVELAMVFLLLITLIFGAIDVLQNLNVQYTISQSVRTAAHEAALLGSTGGLAHGHPYVLKDAPGPVAEAARNVLVGGIFTTDLSKATITMTCATDPCRRYSPITVRIQYADDYLTPLPMLHRLTVDRSATRASEKDQQPET